MAFMSVWRYRDGPRGIGDGVIVGSNTPLEDTRRRRVHMAQEA